MKWRDDKPFVRWLVEVDYARLEGKKLHSNVSEGTAIYMWEAWTAGNRSKPPVKRRKKPGRTS